MRKRKVLITGAGGMLASDLSPLFSEDNLYAFGREKLDISNRVVVENALFQLRPDLVINCAAFTKVDQCETDPSCYNVNALGPYHLAHACRKIKAKLVHISTDYVFDGQRFPHKPYKEDDGRNPLSHYGISKMLGETSIEAELEEKDYLICRVQWLFGYSGQNFVKTMLKLAEANTILKVVCDQIGRPTSTGLLSKSIKQLVELGANGYFHLGAQNSCSWYDFAAAILKDKKVEVLPCTTEQFPRPAKRPKYAVLDLCKAASLGVQMYPWEDHLDSYLGR